MINFNDIKYERPNFKETKKNVERLINDLTNCDNFNDYLELVKEINSIESHIEEMYDYADINNMRHMDDEFYDEEIKYWNEYKIQFDTLFVPYYEELNNSKFKDELRKHVPSNLFKILEYKSKTVSDNIKDLTKQELELKQRFRLLNKNYIMFNDVEYTISELGKFFTNPDRETRKGAHDALNDYYLYNQNEYDSILYDLVEVRNEIARKLGFNNYIELSLYKLKRIDYDYSDISKFRDNIIKYIIPICKTLTEWKKAELKLDKIMYYDSIFFKKMPETKYKGEELLKELRKSFKEVDKELSDMFNGMLDNGLIDFVQRENKVNFSITNYLTESCIPCVTGNYKNNYLDVQTTTHEIGHSFQKYQASLKDKDYIVSPLLKYPTMEVAEMFSYAMELIMMNHVGNIFSKEDYKKYSFMKIYNLVGNLPYICLVDEFQERIYSNSKLKVEDIRKTWKELTVKYHLETQNSGHKNLDDGGYFYRQTHIYTDPFYYIDYALSYFGAFSIWSKSDENLDLFKEIGGVASYYSFKDLIEKYNMPNPFNEDTVKDISNKIGEELKLKRLKNR